MDTLEMIHELKISLWNLSYTYWKTETFLTFKWWTLIFMNVIIYGIWWKIIDKQRLTQLLLFGSFIAVGRIVMDIIGTNTVLWSYDIRELPFFPSPFIHDFTITPLALMLAYQYSSSWRKFLTLTILTTGIISFVFFPLLAQNGYLMLYKWNYFYSFILVNIVAVLSRAVMLGILNIQKDHQQDLLSNSSSSVLNYQPAMKPLDKEKNNTEK